MKRALAVTLALFSIFSPPALAEDPLRPLDTRTRCIVLFRECLVLIEKKDFDGLFPIIADGAASSFKIFPEPPPQEGELKDLDKFFQENFKNAAAIKDNFNKILFSEAVTTDNSASIKNTTTDKTAEGKLHSIKIKLPERDAIGELRFVEVDERLYWVPFGW